MSDIIVTQSIIEGKIMTNILTLQENVSKLITKIEKILEKRIASTDLTERNEDYYKLLNQIKNRSSQLNTLELKMTIVAPMSAGKSTIINAIIGNDLLPTSASAMTTIPTEIILDTNIDEPCLILDNDVLSVSNETKRRLKECIKTQEFSDIEKALGSYPHLIDLALDIRDGKIQIDGELKGYKEIRETLTILNNIFRLYNIFLVKNLLELEPFYSPLYELKNCPKICTPFENQLTASNKTEYMGNLVIIDTPGPNEATQDFTLAPIVKKQLTEKANLILIVLDFTQLNTESAEQIRTEVNEIIKLINKENLYIIVNKIDQRQKDDPLNNEKLEQFIFSQFNLENTEKARIFPISGRQALCASAFINELSQNADKEVKDLKTAESFAQQVYGIDWEEELAESTPQMLKNKVEKLWNKSGFSAFTDNAIQDILKNILPKLIKTSVNLGNNILIELKEELYFKLNTLNSEKNKIENEMEKLLKNQELIAIQQEWLKEKFAERISYFTTDLKKIKDEMESKSSDNILAPQIRKLLSEQKITNKKFTNKEEANRFGDEVYQNVKKFLENWFSPYKDRIEGTIIVHVKRVNIHILNLKIKDILKDVEKQLKNQFDFDISYQISDFDDFSTFVNSPKYQVDINADVPLAGKIHNNFAVKLGSLVRLEIPRVEDEYKVSINRYIKQVSKIIEENIQELAKQIEYFIDQESAQFSSYITNIEKLISNCVKTLEDSLEDQKLSQENFDAKNERLQELLQETNSLLKETEILVNQIENKTKDDRPLRTGERAGVRSNFL